MQLPHELTAAIESAHVAYEGLSHPLRVVEVNAADAQGKAEAVDLVVEAEHEGEATRATCHFTADQLHDTRSVVAALAGAMRAALTSREHG